MFWIGSTSTAAIHRRAHVYSSDSGAPYSSTIVAATASGGIPGAIGPKAGCRHATSIARALVRVPVIGALEGDDERAAGPRAGQAIAAMTASVRSW